MLLSANENVDIIILIKMGEKTGISPSLTPSSQLEISVGEVIADLSFLEHGLHPLPNSDGKMDIYQNEVVSKVVVPLEKKRATFALLSRAKENEDPQKWEPFGKITIDLTEKIASFAIGVSILEIMEEIAANQQPTPDFAGKIKKGRNVKLVLSTHEAEQLVRKNPNFYSPPWWILLRYLP